MDVRTPAIALLGEVKKTWDKSQHEISEAIIKSSLQGLYSAEVLYT